MGEKNWIKREEALIARIEALEEQVESQCTLEANSAGKIKDSEEKNRLLKKLISCLEPKPTWHPIETVPTDRPVLLLRKNSHATPVYATWAVPICREGRMYSHWAEIPEKED